MTLRRPRILVVDDEPEIQKYTASSLRTHGYQVLTADDGSEALKIVSEEIVHLVLLDIMMPGPNGFEVCQAIRRDSAVPIIMLSSRGQERDKVRALDAGADDYLTKPFGVEELLARVRAVMRRSGIADATSAPAVHTQDFDIDFGRRRITANGQEITLTPTEFNLLAHLARNAGKVLTHRAILQSVWGPEYGDETDYLWAYVRRLRRKMEPDPQHPRYLITEAGVGYRLEIPTSHD